MLNRIDFQIVVSLWKTGLAFATSWSFSIEILNNLYELSTLSASVPNGTIFLWFMITSVYPSSCIYFKLIFFHTKVIIRYSGRFGSFAFAEGLALCVGAKPNLQLVRLAKIELKNVSKKHGITPIANSMLEVVLLFILVELFLTRQGVALLVQIVERNTPTIEMKP